MESGDQIKGRWNEVKGRLKEHWGQLTDNDLQRAEGSAEQLVGVVQQKTGASRSEIENFIDSFLGENLGTKTKEAAQHYADVAQRMAADAGEYAQHQAQRLADQSGKYSAKVMETVRARPGESLAIAFAVGIAAGAVLFMGRRR